MQDDGWTRLPRGRVKSGDRGGIAFLAMMLLVVAGFIILGSLGLHPFFLATLCLVVPIPLFREMLAVGDLIWGAGAGVAVSRQPVRTGETFKVRCTLSRPRNARGCRVTWQGREEAVLRGYDSETFREMFFRQELSHALGETVTIEIPPDAMPSFRGKNARIIWSISVETEERGGPIASDFPILVLPGRS